MVKFDNVTKLHYDKKRPAKVGNLIQQAVKAYDSGQVRFHPHAEDREVLRGINRAEAEQAMRNGRHIKKRDQFDEKYKTWKYCVEGKTLDKRKIRTIFILDSEGVLIITFIEPKE